MDNNNQASNEHTTLDKQRLLAAFIVACIGGGIAIAVSLIAIIKAIMLLWAGVNSPVNIEAQLVSALFIFSAFGCAYSCAKVAERLAIPISQHRTVPWLIGGVKINSDPRIDELTEALRKIELQLANTTALDDRIKPIVDAPSSAETSSHTPSETKPDPTTKS